MLLEDGFLALKFNAGAMCVYLSHNKSRNLCTSPQHISSALSLGYAVDPVYKFFRFLFCNKIAYQIIFGDIVDLVRARIDFFKNR